MTNLNKTLDALDAALKAAAPGPLSTLGPGAEIVINADGLWVASYRYPDIEDDAERAANAALHVAAVNAAPMLLRITRAAAARVEAERLYAFAVATEAVDLDALCEAKDAAESALIAALDDAEAEEK